MRRMRRRRRKRRGGEHEFFLDHLPGLSPSEGENLQKTPQRLDDLKEEAQGNRCTVSFGRDGTHALDI